MSWRHLYFIQNPELGAADLGIPSGVSSTTTRTLAAQLRQSCLDYATCTYHEKLLRESPISFKDYCRVLPMLTARDQQLTSVLDFPPITTAYGTVPKAVVLTSQVRCKNPLELSNSPLRPKLQPHVIPLLPFRLVHQASASAVFESEGLCWLELSRHNAISCVRVASDVVVSRLLGVAHMSGEHCDSGDDPGESGLR